MKIHLIKLVKKRLVRQNLLSVDTGEFLPEGFFVALCPIVFYHGGSTCPDGIHKLLRLVAVGSQLGGKKFEIPLGKSIVVHGEQRPVQIKQNRCKFQEYPPLQFFISFSNTRPEMIVC